MLSVIQPRNRMSLWLIGVISFLAILSLVEGAIILTLRGAGEGGGLAARLLPSRWLEKRHGGEQPPAPNGRIVLLDSAEDLALIHERINRLFSTLGGATADAASLAMPGLPPAASLPTERVAELRNEIDQIFENAFGPQDIFSLPARLEQGWKKSAVFSSLRIEDRGSNVLVRLDLPDADTSSIAITLQGRLLTIACHRDKERRRGADAGYARHDYEETKLMLPAPADAEAARASYQDGVLRIEIPKTADQEPLAQTIKLI